MRSLRARVTLAAVGSVAIVVLLAGSAFVGFVMHDQRIEAEAMTNVRVLVHGTVRFKRGDQALPWPPPSSGRSAIMEARGIRWRVRTVPLGQNAYLQMAVEAQRTVIGRVADRAIRLGLLALALTGGLGWAAATLVLRPLARLRAAAAQVADTQDLTVRVPEEQGVAEVDTLAAGLNAMLARLEEAAAATEAALDASRRFAADAGHELRTPLTSMQANLDALARNPSLEPEERARLLADVAAEQVRLAALLDALQALARGDAGALARTEPLDLADLVDAAVQAAQARHPSVQFSFVDPGGPVPLAGSSEGLRMLVDNVLENAARHGRPDGSDAQGAQKDVFDGHVRAMIEQRDGVISLIVDDDGPGVPAGERERVFDRFTRGAGARGPGSGLGLAIVAQQARLHGGMAQISDSLLGGARVTVTLRGA
jgi:two-component system, OmpR family, sensor histidine kinase PrrB